MASPILVHRIDPLRIPLDPAMPPEARSPATAPRLEVPRLERIALAQERTALAMELLAERFGQVADRMDADAAEFKKMIANGRTISDRSAQEIEAEDVRRKAKVLRGKR